MHLDYIKGSPRVYRTRGKSTFYANNHRFVVSDQDLQNPGRIAASVACANKAQPNFGPDSVVSITVAPEPVANRLGQTFAWLVPGRHVLPVAITTNLMAVGIALTSPSHTASAPHWAVYIAIWVIVLWHELGHAAAAARTGIRTDGIGVGFYLIFPVMLTKVSMIAILPRDERIAVFASGILFQGYAAIVLACVQLVAPNIVIEHALYANAIIALFNILPILRFDGHHIANEYIEKARDRNPSTRIFVTLRWFNRLTLVTLIANFIFAVSRTLQSAKEGGLTWANLIAIAVIVL
ncbi:MAG: M50 family metallopeptidase, partial [Novosphingobium sp.]|nr:M50 family metallopeptidase [Novosphingobium sp.]